MKNQTFKKIFKRICIDKIIIRAKKSLNFKIILKFYWKLSFEYFTIIILIIEAIIKAIIEI